MTSLDTPRAKNIALLLLAMTQFMIVVDASIVNVALPSIGRELEFSRENLSWVINAYTLVFGGFLLLGGRMADLLGRRRLFMLGLGVFSVASLVGGLSSNDVMLIVARAFQGLGAALVSPAALSIVTTTFAEGAERNRALGVWGAVAGAGGAAGVLLGGVLTEYLGWEWVLWVNVPIGALAIFLAPRLLPESRDEVANRTFDLPGAFTVTAGLALLVYTIVDAESAGWTSGQTLGLGAVALVLIGTFLVIESRTRAPLMPLGIFRLRTLRGANVVGLLIGMSLFSMFFFISLYLQQVLGFSALETGLAYLPLSIFIILSAGAASQLVTRLGFKPVPVAHRGRRARLLLRPRDDRRRDRDEPGRGGPGLRAHQHLAADRRRARRGDPRLRGQLGHERLHAGRPRRRPHGGLPERVPRGGGLRRAGRDPHAGAHLEQGLARDGGQGQGRRGPGRRRRLTWPDCGPRATRPGSRAGRRPRSPRPRARRRSASR
jgi:MFS family permease